MDTRTISSFLPLFYQVLNLCNSLTFCSKFSMVLSYPHIKRKDYPVLHIVHQLDNSTDNSDDDDDDDDNGDDSSGDD